MKRWASRIASPLVVVVAATTLGQMPAQAAGPLAWKPSSPADVAGVPVVDARAANPASWTAESRALRGPRPVVWPAAGEASVDLNRAVSPSNGAQAASGSGPVRAGSLPIKIGQAAVGDVLSSSRLANPGITKATVKVYDRATTATTGVAGLLFGVTRADGRQQADKVAVEVDYSGFADAFGDWASRLRLVARPACALSTPHLPECQTSTPLPSTNNISSSTLSADVPVTANGMTLLAAQAGPSGDNGSFTATSLSQAGTWNVGTQTGDFTWSYPLRTPPSLGGPAPGLAIGYSSGSVDGRTATTNNQGGWIGDGFDMWPGFIERKYAPCADDNPSHQTGDQCWFNSNATLSLSGHAGELIETGTPNVWRLKKDDGTRIERLADAARANGDNDNEYWKVTTTDGTQYFFGYHKLPGWSADKPVTNSTWTVPVNGNNSGEPCYQATFANAFCDQAWRWNLDYVIDPHDNTMAYFYGKEAGWYGRDNTPSQRTEYVRGGWLDRIEYGTRKDSEYSAAAPMRILFNTAERCLSGCWSGTPWASAPVPSAWADTPWDQDCSSAPCTDKTSPTFWSARRLAKVTAQVRSAATTYRDVESWALRHEFLEAGDNEGSPMWLRGITRTGHVTTAGGIQVSDPEIVFGPGAEPLPNRVDRQDGRTLLTRFRVKTVTTESGGQIIVTYSGQDCNKDALPAPESNTTRCMPAFYAPAGAPTLDWFNKYVVTSVTLHDTQYTAGDGSTVDNNPDQTSFYDYLDSPAWHYTDDELTKPEFKTWGDWRGHGRVQVRTGATGDQQTATEYRHLRGMDGDHLPTGLRDVSVTDWGGTVDDHEALNGFLRQTITFNGPGGAEISSTVNDPWLSGPVATRTRNGVTVNAWTSNVGTTRTRKPLAAGGFRTVKTTTGYNSDGFKTTVDAFGDQDADGDETCTRFSYARNDSIWLIDKVSQMELLSGTCAAASTPAAPSTVLSRARTFYDTYVDGSSFGAAPSKGAAVRTEHLDKWVGSTPVYERTTSMTYDSYGRLLDAFNPLGHKTTAAYTTDAATGLVTGTTETNPLNHVVVTAVEPAWQQPTRITDANSVVTDLTYDGLGRLTNVWLPGRNKANQTPSRKYTYNVRATGGPTTVTTETLLPTGNQYLKSIELFDGFLRQRQTQTQATGGGRTITEVLHNAMGSVDWTSAAYYDQTNAAVSTSLAAPTGQIPSINKTVYDGAGRQTSHALIGNGAQMWATTTTYQGERIHTTPPAGGIPTTTISNAAGQTAELRQYKATSDLGSDDPAKFDKTGYTYTLSNQLKTVTDPAGNVWSYSYDLRGRQNSVSDPDKGTSLSTYDSAGQLATVTSPLGSGTATLAFTYDAVGRKTSVRDGSATGPKRAEWIYDQTLIKPAGVNQAKGKLTSATRYTGGNAYVSTVDAYDIYGRATSTSVTLPAAETDLCAAIAPNTCTYTTTTTYRPNGQPSTVTMPAAGDLAGEKLTYGYTDVGDPGTLYSASQVYVNAISYNKLGQLTGRTFGTSTLQVSTVYGFDERSRRLTNMYVEPTSQPRAVDYSYDYDNAGNVKKISDAPAGQTADHQCYDYDYLRRLTQGWTPATANCGTTPTVATLGGPAPYWHSWTFDAIGNRKTEVRHGTTDTTFTYSHPTSGAGSVRPHTVTNVTASGGQTWNRNYTYDNAGNTATRPTTAGGTQTLTFDAEGHLASLAEGSNSTGFIYDADGNRLIRRDPDSSKTLYIGNTEVRYNKTPSTKTATRYYTHGDAVIGVRTAAGLHWIVSDHHGTAEVVIKASDLTVAKRRTLPYGEQRGTTTGTWAAGMDKGFVGGTIDPTGLTHTGAREYDPSIGRFISVDPVMVLADPQQMHGYAYSHNNPATFSDPTGLEDTEGDECANGACDSNDSGGGGPAETPGDIIEQLEEEREEALYERLEELAYASAVIAAWLKAHWQDLVNVAIDVLDIVVGVLAIFEGGAAIGGGGVVCAGGVTCILGGPAIVGGVALAAAGVTLAGMGAASLGKDLQELAKTKGERVKTNYDNGKQAEADIAAQYPGAERNVYRSTKEGGRFIDVLTPEGAAIESKLGRTNLSGRIREELAKDKELMTRGLKVEWHFTRSPLTGLGGPSGPLRRELERAGIKVVIR